jgi:hypothetical protein
MSTEKLKEKCVNYYKKLKKKSSKCRVKDLRKFAINIVARPVIISHAQRWNRYTIPHRCSARNTCIHCNMCNNARLETRKIGLHFCGTSPYTREPHQLLFTGAEPERLISHHQGRAVPVRLTELCRSNDINNKKLIRYIDWWTTWHHICVLVIVCSVVECYSCWFCGITAIDRWVGPFLQVGLLNFSSRFALSWSNIH